MYEFSKQELEIFLEGARDMAVYSTLTYIHTFLDEILKFEVKESDKVARKLTAEEILVELKNFLKSITNDLEKKLNLDSKEN